jgi:hypothetical protein
MLLIMVIALSGTAAEQEGLAYRTISTDGLGRAARLPNSNIRFYSSSDLGSSQRRGKTLDRGQTFCDDSTSKGDGHRYLRASPHLYPYTGSFRLQTRSCDITHVKMSISAMDEWMPIILEMMESPPEPNKPLPLANQFKTVMGVTIPFLVRTAMMPKFQARY